MRENYIHESAYFFGNAISEYGIQNGYIDYRTLAKSFDAVLNNEIFFKTFDRFYWDLVNGCDYDEETENTAEIFQWYIISDRGAEILQEYTNEIVYYNEELDMYLWGVTHYGTAWDYVLTDIKITKEVKNNG